MHKTTKTDSSSGFSLFELLGVVSVLGVFAALTFPIISDIRESSQSAKLDSELGVLNSATKAYLASSGDLSTAKTAADVLQKLKSRASDSSSAVYNGFRGSFLDTRTEFVYQSAEEGNSSDRRLVWDASSQEFISKRSGAPGVKEVRLNNDLAESPVMYEDRQGIMNLATKDKWIWDFTDSAPAAKLGTTPVTFTAPVTTSAALPPPPAYTPPPPAPSLSPPIFSIPTGTYAIEDYPMSLDLIDPNPVGSANIYYQVDFSGWKLYGGESLTIEPYSRVAAQAIPRDPAIYSASIIAGENYDIIPVVLDPPVIIPDVESFGYFSSSPISITLANTNLPGRALIEFSINSGPWMQYTAPFLLAPELFPSGATVEARSISAGSPYYLPSSASLKYLPTGSLDLLGSTVGEFSDPIGTSSLVSNLSPGDSSSYFEWGDGKGNGLSESWLEFEGATFGNIIDGQQFNIGSLEYYNGTILGDTGASAVNFELALTLDINGQTYNPYFDFEFELINQVNTTDPIASADFVFLDDARSSRTLVFNDYEFEFKIEFGNTSDQGFSFIDQFFVLENEKASADLFGTFTLIGPASETQNDSTKGGLIIADDAGTGTFLDPLYQKLGYQDPEQFSKSLLSDATKARNNALQAKDNAEDYFKDTQDAHSTFIDEHQFDNYYKAEAALNEARIAERLLQEQADAANVSAFLAENIATKAKTNASIDPASLDEALEIVQLAAEARSFSDEARAMANVAASLISQIESLWSNTLATAPSSDDRAEDFARYLADKAKEEEDRAKSLSSSAQINANNTISRAEDLTGKISDGKFLEAETLYQELSQMAGYTNNLATWTENAATRARSYAFEATDIADNEDDAEEYANNANVSAGEASAYAAVARIAATQASAAASQAKSEWDAILSTGAANFPVEFATYLQEKAKVARDEAKSARDDAKSEGDHAITRSEETIKKLAEGKLNEALEKYAEAEIASDAAESATLIAAAHAFDARTFAVQAEMIAASTPSAKSIATNATTFASEAETYADEARVFADESLVFLDDAKALLP